MDRLTEFGRVTVNLPRLGGARRRVSDFDCTVIALEPFAAVLQPFSDDATSLPRRLEHVLLAFEHEGRLVGLKGVLINDPPMLRFTVEDGVQVPRRRSTRVRLELPLRVRNLRTAQEAPGVTRDISLSGMLVSSAIEAARGDALEIAVEPPGESPVDASGVIVRQSPGLLAVEFTRHGASLDSTLRRFIIAEQQQSLGAARPAPARR